MINREKTTKDLAAKGGNRIGLVFRDILSLCEDYQQELDVSMLMLSVSLGQVLAAFCHATGQPMDIMKTSEYLHIIADSMDEEQIGDQ